MYINGVIKLFRFILIAMRPKHWIKNLLVFALPFSDGLIIGSNFDSDSIWRALVIFLSLSGVSSANYIFNDIRDIEADRLHVSKKNRPFAAGELSKQMGIYFALTLLIISLSFSLLIGNPFTTLIVFLFGVLQFVYTLLFKHMSGYDLVTLSSLYVFRAVLPATYEQIVLSKWFLVIFFAGALFLASGKRYAEIRSTSAELGSRKVLKSYSELQLALWMAVSLALLIMSYLNWIFTFTSSENFPVMLASLFPLCILLIKVSFLTMSEGGEDPTRVIFKHKDSLVLIGIWLILYLVGKEYL
jgi:decaprenyl-phosphate phosphoribosyltransferase